MCFLFFFQESTGAVLLSTEPSKLIFYRGWPPGEERPDLVALKKDEHASDNQTSDVKELEALSDDEGNSTDDDDLGIDAWNEEDWEEADEDDEDEDEDKDVEFEEDDEEEGLDDGTAGQWVSFSGEESDYSDTDVDELVTAIPQGDKDVTVEKNGNQISDNRE